MILDITFTALGLNFTAEVDYDPAVPTVYTRPGGDPGYEGDNERIEILTLDVGKNNAMFMLTSPELKEAIEAAACTVAAEKYAQLQRPDDPAWPEAA